MTPFQRLQQSLPKPALFALYGALGGLLGALIVGEILWLLLRPPSVRVVTVPPLRLAPDSSVRARLRVVSAAPLFARAVSALSGA